MSIKHRVIKKKKQVIMVKKINWWYRIIEIGERIYQTEIEDIHKISDERDRIDNEDHKKSDDRYQIREIQADEIDLE